MNIVMIGHKGVPAEQEEIETYVETLSMLLTMRGCNVLSFDRSWYVRERNPMAGVRRRWSFGVRVARVSDLAHTLYAIGASLFERPDVIHIHGIHAALLIPLARWVHPSVRIVATIYACDAKRTIQTGFFSTWKERYRAYALSFAHHVHVVTESVALYCLETYDAQGTIVSREMIDTLHLPSLFDLYGVCDSRGVHAHPIDQWA